MAGGGGCMYNLILSGINFSLLPWCAAHSFHVFMPLGSNQVGKR